MGSSGISELGFGTNVAVLLSGSGGEAHPHPALCKRSCAMLLLLQILRQLLGLQPFTTPSAEKLG